MRSFALCLLFVFGVCPMASAQEQAPKAPVDGRVLQALLDIDAKLERLSELVDADRTDRQHDEAQLREECAALKENQLRMETKMRELQKELEFEKVLRNAQRRDEERVSIERQLSATRWAPAGRLGVRKQRVYVVTGAERAALIARREELRTQWIQTIVKMMSEVTIPSFTSIGGGIAY